MIPCVLQRSNDYVGELGGRRGNIVVCLITILNLILKVRKIRKKCTITDLPE